MIKQKEFNPRIYMELAIEEMNKSRIEPRSDGKVPPKVGAILLFPDGQIERAHRGELRDGDHAEFSLLERKLGNKKLEDCILFTTLEPCFRRNPPKIECCKRVLKTRIKTVYVGIADPDHTVDGKGIGYLQDRKVKVIMFDRDLQKRIEDENVEFIKQANARKKKKEEEVQLSPLETSVPAADFNQFSEEALQKFIFEAKLSYKIKDNNFKQYLAEIGALQLEDKAFRPTGIGILLFGTNPRTRFKQAVLKASVDYGDNKTEYRDFAQPLVLVPDLVEEWLKKVLPLSKDTTSFRRKDITDFPIEILREAVINAIVHRDYSIEGAKATIEIDNDKIVVKSPGAPLPSININQLNTFKAPSISRNPSITYVFNLMNYAEEKGFGMKSFKSLNEKFGLPLPEYIFADPFLTLTFPRNLESLRKVSNLPALNSLSNDELKGYEFIKLKGSVTRKEYQEHFAFSSDKKAERHLKKMVDIKLILRKGSGPSTFYAIIPT
jgi:ATP-dependent DNA helicase RecG